jgi:hypothetical protein
MQSSETSNTDSTNLLTIRQFADKYPAFSESSLRWLIFNREENGFSAAFIKLGRRMLIYEQKFFHIAVGKTPHS